MKKIVVIKYGGHAFQIKESVDVLIKNIKKLHKDNFGVVIVHGGTPTVNAELKARNIKAEMIDGLRVTTKEVIDIVEKSLVGKDTLDIVKILNKNDINAIGLNGADCNLLKCIKFKHQNGIDYGMVGEVINVNTSLLNNLIDNNIVSVISPLGVDDFGNGYNLNTDFLTDNVAKSLAADMFIMVTNIDGIRKDINDSSTRVETIDKKSMDKLIKENIINGRMVTKIEACMNYTDESKKVCYIVDANQIIDYKLFSTNSFGTKTVCESNFEFRLACIEDIEKISKIVKRAFIDYQKNITYPASPLYETYEDLVMDIRNNNVYVGVVDGKIIGSVRMKIELPYARAFRLCVDPKNYNKGYGSKMLNYIEHYASQKGANYIGLTTIGDVERLKRFYEKNEYKVKFTNNSRGYPKVLLVKNIQKEKININWFLN